MTQSGWELVWATDWDEVFSDQYCETWRELYESPDRFGPRSPFCHPDVVRAWYRSRPISGSLRPRFLTAKSDSGLTLFWPLVSPNLSWRKGYVRKLRSVGAGMFDYNDPIVVGESASSKLLPDMWSTLLGQIEGRLGRDFDEFSVPSVRVGASPESSGWKLAGTSPYLDLRPYDDIDQYISSRRSNLRGDVRRRLRRADETGQLRYQTEVSATRHEVGEWIQLLDQFRMQRYPDAGSVRGFLEALLEFATGADKPAWFTAICLNETSIAWHAGFKDSDSAYWFVPGFDTSAAPLSPGKLHVYFSIREALESGCACFDFLRGEETYKSGWSDGDSFQTFSYRCSSRTMNSRMRRSASRIATKFLNTLPR